MSQALLKDVTKERQRQLDLQSQARQVIQAQEEERKCLAQELHDDAVQALVLLCRNLDTLQDDPQLPLSSSEGLTQMRHAAEDVVGSLRRAVQP